MFRLTSLKPFLPCQAHLTVGGKFNATKYVDSSECLELGHTQTLTRLRTYLTEVLDDVGHAGLDVDRILMKRGKAKMLYPSEDPVCSQDAVMAED